MSGFNFSEFEEYSSAIESLKNGVIDQEYRNAANIIAKKFAHDVAKRTPHDTGDLQKNWKYRVFKEHENEYIILVWNPMEYAEYVENGHRLVSRGRVIKPWIEGRFMMKTTYDEIDKLMPNVQKNIERKIKELLNG